MKTTLLLFLTTACLSLSGFAAPTKIEEIEQFIIRSYSPQKAGLNDLVFEARVNNLTDILNKTQSLGKLTDVYFKIYWMAPSQYRVEVMGLPEGFQEVRADLAALIKGKLEFVIPENLADKLNGYTLTSENVPEGKLVRGSDSAGMATVSEIALLFDAGGKLKSVETKAPYASGKTEYAYSPKSWSNNKLVLDKTQATSKNGGSTLVIIHALEYASVAGIGLPKKIQIKNLMESIVMVPENDKKKGNEKPKFKEKKIKNESSTVIDFTNYEVNTGKARRFIMEGQRR